jgi:hypothetical protein
MARHIAITLIGIFARRLNICRLKVGAGHMRSRGEKYKIHHFQQDAVWQTAIP